MFKIPSAQEKTAENRCIEPARLRMIPPSSLVITSGMGLIDLPLRASFSPAHPLADIFHPPYPPIASQSISRDVPLALARASCFLLWTITLSRPGSRRTVLHRAHRTIYKFPPSLLVSLSGMAPVLVPLRPSNEHILIVRVPGARDRRGCHSTPFIVRVLRARRAPGRSPPHFSASC
jgi:hypothetical protein